MTVTKKLWIATIAASPALAEAIAAPLGDDALALTIIAPPRARQARIEALYDAEPDRAELTARLAIAAAMHRAKPPKIDIREMPKMDWLEKVAGDFPPLPVARWIVHGAQHRKAVLRPRVALQIDAASAFGTGEHPTTRGCLLMLDGVLKRRRAQHMLDLGCGSGILAMAYAKSAGGRAIAIDCDTESVRVAKDNVRINGLQREITIALGNGYDAPLVRRNAPYDLVMANIFAGPLCRMAKDLKRHLRPDGIAILSGILNRQANTVLAAHRMQGIYLAKRLRIGEWAVLALRRPKKALSCR